MSAAPLSLLIVEDERALAHFWASELGSAADCAQANTLAAARQKIHGRAFDSILLDLHLPDGDGMDLLRELTEHGSEAAVIVLTASPDVESAIQALRLGAYDYLIKPLVIVDLKQRLVRIARERAMRDENVALRQQIGSGRHPAPARLVGEAPAMIELKNLMTRVAPANTSVLIQGETGTGKEVAARLIHRQSARAEAAFVPVNCAALPRETAESELFGHRQGAFTGAQRDHRGLVQAAAGGTLFLDEVGDLPPEAQATFLRLLESGEGRRVGDTEAYVVDVRVIAATHRDLQQEIVAGRFRRDLYYRLASFELKMPPLRTIPEDLPAIAQYLLDSIVVPEATAQTFTPPAIEAMRRYRWPGNVRELRNVIERAKILCDQDRVEPRHLALGDEGPIAGSTESIEKDVMSLAHMERLMIQRALRASGGNKTAAARTLGVSLRTLYNKLEAFSAANQEE